MIFSQALSPADLAGHFRLAPPLDPFPGYGRARRVVVKVAIRGLQSSPVSSTVTWAGAQLKGLQAASRGNQTEGAVATHPVRGRRAGAPSH